MKAKWTKVFTSMTAAICMIGLLGLGWSLWGGSQDISIKTLMNRTAEKDTSKVPKISVVNKENLRVLALGDSLTRGTGDPSGKGYVGYLVDRLKANSRHKVSLSNIAVNGEKSDQLLVRLKEKEVRKQVESADIIVMTIGGNDLLNGGQSLANLNFSEIQKDKAKYVQNLTAILSELRSINGDANIFYVGLYNPFSDMDYELLTSSVIRNWNAASAEVCAGFPKTTFVPTFDLFPQKVEDYLAADKFHPNAEGYQLMAERLVPLVLQ
ncbi:SGNH/GDSL hydrolase family protein [Heliobacterium chlorum]|uniref:SGNH/GDSL hydrolase family protein n=1 Tax=Heliobacterium chlorum TaxID=2698 RepID=A0ABR7T7R5_HELCL|nr:SGNH/GDSL hydrolase family protein [Heliobacterium chlorum]MBC9786252.1 SGNH/GDSL hydrolase family protein [Heliobacterium chlorum]